MSFLYPGEKDLVRSHETGYNISSLELDAQEIGRTMRSH